MGGPNSFLLFPKTNELTNPGNTGKRTEFLGGNIYWSAATGAKPVAHDFLTKWGEKGYEGGYLKYPTTDEIVLPDGVNRRQEFQGGSIYWAAGIGAHTLQGAIKDKWIALGAQGTLGFPTSDEKVAPDGVGRYNTFQHGSIYWSPATGAHSVVGRVLKAWGDAGYEGGTYGYPTAEQTSPDNGVTVKQNFQRGTITAPGPKVIELAGYMEWPTTPEQVLDDAIDAAAAAAEPLASAIEGALVEAGDSNSGGPRDPDDAVAIPLARGAGDLFYSDASTGKGPVQYEHGHNGIYVNTADTVQALDPDRGVQLVSGTDTTHKLYNPEMMWVNTTGGVRSHAVQYARAKIGSGYNNNFAFNRRDWDYFGPGDTYNCSQLVWAAYMNATGGSIDLDGDGGWGVWPKDILESDWITMYP